MLTASGTDSSRGHPTEQYNPRLCGGVWPDRAQGSRQARGAVGQDCAGRGSSCLGARSGYGVNREYVRFQGELKEIEAELMAWHRADAVGRRLAQIPSVGPIIATTLVMKTPDPRAFRSGRHFAAWLGLTPKDHSTAGKTRLGKITRADDEDLRRLLVIGATSVIQQARSGRGQHSRWLLALIKRKPPKLAAVALANKVARIAWKLMATGESYDAARMEMKGHSPPNTDWRTGARSPSDPELQEQMEQSVDQRYETVRGTHWPPAGRQVVWNSCRANHLGQRLQTIASTGRTYACKRSDPAQKALVPRGPSTYGSRPSPGRRFRAGRYSPSLPAT